MRRTQHLERWNGKKGKMIKVKTKIKRGEMGRWDGGKERPINQTVSKNPTVRWCKLTKGVGKYGDTRWGFYTQKRGGGKKRQEAIKAQGKDGVDS